MNTVSGRLARNEVAIWSDLGDRVAFLCVAQDLLFETDGVGKTIWDFLEEPRTIEDIVEHIHSAYRIDRESCGADVRAFLANLVENGIVHRTDSAPAD